MQKKKTKRHTGSSKIKRGKWKWRIAQRQTMCFDLKSLHAKAHRKKKKGICNIKQAIWENMKDRHAAGRRLNAGSRFDETERNAAATRSERSDANHNVLGLSEKKKKSPVRAEQAPPSPWRRGTWNLQPNSTPIPWSFPLTVKKKRCLSLIARAGRDPTSRKTMDSSESFIRHDQTVTTHCDQVSGWRNRSEESFISWEATWTSQCGKIHLLSFLVIAII